MLLYVALTDIHTNSSAAMFALVLFLCGNVVKIKTRSGVRPRGGKAPAEWILTMMILRTWWREMGGGR